MGEAQATENRIHLNQKDLFHWGGISAIVLGIAYILITSVYILGGALPKGAEEWLKFLASHSVGWWLILALSVLTDFLFLPVAFVLYSALKEINRTAMLIGAGLLGMFALLDLAVTWPNYAALMMLSRSYATASPDAQRMVLVAAASYASAVLTSSLFSVYAILLPSLGILIIGFVMLKGPFHKATAYSGLAAGVVGTLAVVGPVLMSALGMAAILASILTTAWVLFAGVDLLKLGSLEIYKEK